MPCRAGGRQLLASKKRHIAGEFTQSKLIQLCALVCPKPTCEADKIAAVGDRGVLGQPAFGSKVLAKRRNILKHAWAPRADFLRSRVGWRPVPGRSGSVQNRSHKHS